MSLRESVGNRLRSVGRAVRLLANPPDMALMLDTIRALRETAELDEPGWLPLSSSAEAQLSSLDLHDIRLASHYYFLRDPIFRRAVQLIRDYTFGRGMSWRAVDDRATETLDRFWNDPRNKKTISRATAQWGLSEKLQLDGEVFFLFFVNKGTGHVVMRTVPVEEIPSDGLITHPEDKETELYYRREWQRTRLNWETMKSQYAERVVDFIPDWTNQEGKFSGKGTVEDDEVAQYMHHLKINTHTSRGVPLHFCSLPWVKVYRGFMEDRAVLTMAQAIFAFKHKIKGSSRAVARAVADWGAINLSHRYAAGGKERREGGRTYVENEPSDLQPWTPRTGGSEAYTDGRMLRQQIAAGTGITEPDLTGDAQAGTYATISSMAASMLKGFEAQQQIWADEVKDNMAFVIQMAKKYGKLPKDVSEAVEVDMPPITTRDLNTTLNAIGEVLEKQTKANLTVMTPRRMAVEILKAFGETDIEAALTEVEKWQARQDGLAAQSQGEETPLFRPEEVFSLLEPGSDGDGRNGGQEQLERQMAVLVLEMARLRDRLDVQAAREEMDE